MKEISLALHPVYIMNLLILSHQFSIKTALRMYFLIDGQISSFCPDQHGGEAFNPNNVKKKKTWAFGGVFFREMKFVSSNFLSDV
jgi:hypothetical protein